MTRTILPMMLMALLVTGCTPSPTPDPFAVDSTTVNNKEAFHAAAGYIHQHWERLSAETGNGGVDSFLSTKGLRLGPYRFFYLNTYDDSSIRFTDKKYILVGDSVFRHSIKYTRKPLGEVMPSAVNRQLIRKVDSNLYYIVTVECAGC